MWNYLTTAQGGRMTPLERTLLMCGVFLPFAIVAFVTSSATDPDQLLGPDLVFLTIAVIAVTACSELSWWVRLFIIGLSAAALQIAVAYIGAKPHALHPGFVLSVVLTNGIDGLTSGRTDLPGFYRVWAAAAQSALWRGARWGAYYVVSFVVIMMFSACTSYWIDLIVSEFVPSPGIARKDDWFAASILAMVAVIAVLMIGRPLPEMLRQVRLLRPALLAIASSALWVAVIQIQLLYFHHMGIKTWEWQMAVIKEAAAEWESGILDGLSVSAVMIVVLCVFLVPLFILVTALSDRAKAQGHSSRLAAVLISLGLILICLVVGGVLGSLLLGSMRGTPEGAGYGSFVGNILGLVGAAGWLIWKRAFGRAKDGQDLLSRPARYATGVAELPADVASAVDAARAATAPR